MKKIALVMAAIAIASVFVGCGPKAEDAAKDGGTAGGNGTPDTKSADTPK